MKFEAGIGAIRSQAIEARAVNGSIELGGYDDGGLGGEFRTEGGQLPADNFKIAHGIAVRGIAGIDEMRNQARAFDMLQKASAEPGAFMGAFDKAGEIGDDESSADAFAGSAVGRNHAQMRLKSGEGIIRDFGMRGGNARNQRGFAGIREAHQADVGKQLELEAQMMLFARLALFGLARRLVPGLREVLVAPPAAAPARHNHALAGRG